MLYCFIICIVLEKYTVIILSLQTFCLCSFLPLFKDLSMISEMSREPSLRALRGGNTTVIEETNNFTCAPHIPKQNRKVLYINAIGMETYTTNLEQEFMSGEFYALASWEHAIQQNGFIVDEVTFEEVLDLPDTILHEYHRIVLGCVYSDWNKKCSLHNDEEYLMKLSQKLRIYSVKAKIDDIIRSQLL